MITYVNTVFVSNNTTDALLTSANISAITAANVATYKGRFAIYDVDANTYSVSASTTRFKIGMITGKMNKDHEGVSHPDIKWSNIINAADIKSLSILSYPGADTEDTVTIDFTGIDSSVLNVLAEGGKRIVVRLTFKDLPTRFRKWTESYEYVTSVGDTAATIASGIATIINKQWKRARVTADGTTTSGKLVLTAMKYDDDDSVDSINWANKIRFNANIYYTNPAAEGWESLNKHFPNGVAITKVPGSTYAASAKLVRDREAQAMGYQGILNRGEGTWPIIKPAMETNLAGTYDAITLEFENMYRAADDIFRKNKQAVEIYKPHKSSDGAMALVTAINTILGNNDRAVADSTTEKGNITA